MISPRPLTGLLLVLLLGGVAPIGLSAQTDTLSTPYSAREEAGLLREASSHEWRGRLDEAEEVLQRLLTRNPASSGGLFALERILRTRSRVAEVLPWVDRYLVENTTASGPRYMKLRVLVEVDSLEALEATAQDWFDVEPDSPDPYREVGRIYQRVFGDERAMEVFLAGRDAADDESVLALEIGDVRQRLGDAEGAVEEWARALEDPRADVEAVLRRLERLEGDRASLAEPLLSQLTGAGASEERRRAAVRVAIELGPPDMAQRVAAEGLRGLSREATPAFLQDVARRADDAGLADLSLWALTTLRRTVPAAASDAAMEARMASVALAAADTAAAVEAQIRLARALAPGSVERRRAISDLTRIEAVFSGVDGEALGRRLEGFRAEFPDAPETDPLTAAVAAGLALRGDAEGALALVDPPPGPQSELERAWLLLDAGELAAGREALSGALVGLAPSAATEVIQLIALLDRVGPSASEALARSAARQRHGDRAAARDALVSGVEAAAEDDRPALLFQAGRLAEAEGDSTSARALFARIEGAHPDSPEAPEAMLRRARLLAADPARAEEAQSLLERLILERPRAAVVPDARRELDRLRRGT